MVAFITQPTYTIMSQNSKLDLLVEKLADNTYVDRIIESIKKILPLPFDKLYQYPPKPFHCPAQYFQKQPLQHPPKISIVTPSFNQGHFLEKTILSITEQNYPDLEYIIQDGGSSDNSIDIIKKYHTHLHCYESAKDNGQSHAINLGFAHATGDIMAYLNSDDLLLPGSLHYIAHCFETHPDIDIVYGNRVIIDENDLEVGRWILPKHSHRILKLIDYIPQETLFWRRRIWESVGAHIDENFRFAMDWDLILRFQAANAKFVRLPRLLGAFRVHSQQKTSAQINDVGFQEMQLLRTRANKKPVSRGAMLRKVAFYLMRNAIANKLRCHKDQ